MTNWLSYFSISLIVLFVGLRKAYFYLLIQQKYPLNLKKQLEKSFNKKILLTFIISFFILIDFSLLVFVQENIATFMALAALSLLYLFVFLSIKPTYKFKYKISKIYIMYYLFLDFIMLFVFCAIFTLVLDYFGLFLGVFIYINLYELLSFFKTPFYLLYQHIYFKNFNKNESIFKNKKIIIFDDNDLSLILINYLKQISSNILFLEGDYLTVSNFIFEIKDIDFSKYETIVIKNQKFFNNLFLKYNNKTHIIINNKTKLHEKNYNLTDKVYVYNFSSRTFEKNYEIIEKEDFTKTYLYTINNKKIAIKAQFIDDLNPNLLFLSLKIALDVDVELQIVKEIYPYIYYGSFNIEDDIIIANYIYKTTKITKIDILDNIDIKYEKVLILNQKNSEFSDVEYKKIGSFFDYIYLYNFKNKNDVASKIEEGKKTKTLFLNKSYDHAFVELTKLEIKKPFLLIIF